MNAVKKKVLLLSNLDFELNDPYFRLGAYKTYLQTIATTLQRQAEFDTKFLLNKHIFVALKQDQSNSISVGDTILSDPSDEEREPLGTFISDSYLGLSSDREERAIAYLLRLLNGWTPDAVICWEAPTSLLRKAFPEALVIDLMPSMFARPPYPRAVAIDPVGLYKDCWFSPSNLPSPLTNKDGPEPLVHELRQMYLDHFEALNARREFTNLLDIPKGRHTSLVPLQVSAYFGFRDNCTFKNQFEFLRNAAASAKDDVVLCTQYVGGFVSERAITDANLKYLQDNVADVRYTTRLEAIDSVSQFMVPWVDRVFSVSSTLGLQAKFFKKTLIAPTRSHLSYVADANDLAGNASHYMHDGDAFMAAYLSRGMLIFDRITSEDDYFPNVLRDLLARKASNATGLDVLPSAEVVGNSFEKFVAYSKLGPSQRNFKKLFPAATAQSHDPLPSQVDASLNSANVAVVSFDIFDTLVRRTVYKPEDVFMLMQRHLQRDSEQLLPPHVLLRFAEMRQAAERLTRQKRDQEILLEGHGIPEEITIEDVYKTFALSMGVPSIDVKKLIDLEQEVELSVLRPRKVGKLMYERAQAAGKRIVITSDFIHDEQFIRKVLLNCGYVTYERLFLSSTIGKKKHSGDLFDEVLAQTGASPNSILHIGDNPVGDLERAREKNLRSTLVPSGRALIKEGLLKRNVNEAVLNGSFYLRTIAGLYANTYLHTDQRGTSRVDKEKGEFRLISTLEEFGFLVVGPIALSFSEWILERAVAQGASQIVFFARDCYLPYQMAVRIREARGLHDLRLIYAPTSRKSVTGLDLREPKDVLKVRIDDFTSAGTLKRLLEERFLVRADEVPPSLLAKWAIASLEVEKRHIPLASIYGLILELARDSWHELYPRYERRRRDFVDYLTEQSPIDFAAPTVAVDFGYQGSIHRKMDNLFEKPLIPLFFMTYSDGFGGAPIPGGEAFYASSCNSATKSTVALSHNLLLETLMNEGVGSAIELSRMPGGGFEIIRDNSVTNEHAKTISGIHGGALKLCAEWLEECQPLHRTSQPERDAIMYFFGLIAKDPTTTEVNLLQGLVFDNAYAGVRATSLVITAQNKKHNPRVLWPEAERVLARAVVDGRKSGKPTPKTVDRSVPSTPSGLKVAIVRPFVAKLGNKNDMKEFNSDPSEFFAKLRNPYYRTIGRALFPPRR